MKIGMNKIKLIKKIPKIKVKKNDFPESYLEKYFENQQNSIIKGNMLTEEKAKLFMNKAVKELKTFQLVEKEKKRDGFRLLLIGKDREALYKYNEEFEKNFDMSSYVMTGDRSIRKDADYIDEKEPELIFATPGRLMKLLPVFFFLKVNKNFKIGKKNKLKIRNKKSDYFSNLKYFIIDEYEKFEENELEEIRKHLSPFHATTSFITNIEGVNMENPLIKDSELYEKIIPRVFSRVL
jgi:hypothetical protein